jgi:uncharacterized membrane protein YbhN (UPF0104 family)
MDMAQRNRTFRIVQFAAGIAVGILLCYDLGRQADFRQIARSIKSEQLLWILMGLLSVSATIGIRAMRWRILLAPAAPQTRSVDLVGPIVAGQMLNAILPIRGGDLVRAYLAAGKVRRTRSTLLGQSLPKSCWTPFSGSSCWHSFCFGCHSRPG